MLTEEQFLDMVATGETLTLEFKGEPRQALPDNDLAEAVVCLANAEGGILFLGVEDNGTISGIKHRNGNTTDTGRITANIYSRTTPNIHVDIQEMPYNEVTALILNVSKSQTPTCTTRGVYVKRRIGSDGKPTCLPYPPHEMTSDAADTGQLDYTAQKLEKLTSQDLDPLETERLFSVIRDNPRSDRSLLDLPRMDAMKSLQLLKENNGMLVPTVAGLLILGKKEILNSYIPHHEIAFQFFKGTEVPVNEFQKEPLLKSLETIWNYFTARNNIDSKVKDLYRKEIPDYDENAFREAVNNAVSHRDYTVMGTVYIQWREHQREISSPGGLVSGVNLENILSISPTPRNPLLADVFKRIGLVERSGRGVDLIYTGQLKYGRRVPDYSRTTSEKVVVAISKDKPDLKLIQFWNKHESQYGTLPAFEHYYIFDRLHRDKKDSISEISQPLQRTEEETEMFIQQLIDWEYVKRQESDGAYRLSQVIKKRLKEIEKELSKKSSEKTTVKNGIKLTDKADGFVPEGQKKTTLKTVGETVGETTLKTVGKIIETIVHNPRITREDLAAILGLSVRGVEWNLAKLKKEGKIKRIGSTKGGHWKVQK